MLVLSRRIGESVAIGDTIQIVVLDVKGNKVKVGFEAPKTVSIRRCELEVSRSRADNAPPCQVTRTTPRTSS